MTKARVLVTFICTKCKYETQQYDNVKAVYHENCNQRKKGELGVRCEPK